MAYYITIWDTMYIGNSPGIGTKAYGHDSSQLQIQVKVQINCWASRSAYFSYAEALCSLVIKSWFDLCALQLWGCVPCNSGEMHCPCMPAKIKMGYSGGRFLPRWPINFESGIYVQQYRACTWGSCCVDNCRIHPLALF